MGSSVDPADLTAALESARHGDEAAMAVLFRAIHPSLLRYVRHRVPEAAEDLAAECWLAAAKVLATFEGEGEDLRAWLFGVARNQVANHRRASRRRRLLQPGAAVRPPMPEDVAETAIEALATQAAIAALVRDLSGDQADVLLLRVVAGLTAERVAATLGKSPGWVRVTQHRALRRLGAARERPVPTSPVTR